MADYVKDPDALLDYKIDWSVWLTASGGDFITSANASAETGIIIKTSAATSTIHTFFVSGGTVGVEYTITSRIHTNGGRRNDQSIVIAIEEQ